MSFYNMMNGVNPATFFILPMLGEKHPDDYPRFRDCYVEDGDIVVYTRVGGGNRGCGYGEEWLLQHKNFLSTEDDEDDETYGKYYFSVPEEWKSDFYKIVGGYGDEDSGGLESISDEYKARLYMVYPKLKGWFDTIFE